MGDAIIAVITGVCLILSTVLPIWYTKRVNKIVAESHSIPPLKDHPIHSNINTYIRYVENLHITTLSEGRNVLASDFLSYALNCWVEPCKKFSQDAQSCIDECKTNCTSCNALYSLAMNLIQEGMQYEKLVNFNYDVEDKDAVVIFKYKFIDWNHDRLERLTRKVADISLINDTYNNCGIKSARILEAIDDYTYDLYKDGIATIARLNGDLSGKKYKGYTL